MIMNIKVELPDKLSQDELNEAADYCYDALTSWGGQRHPDDWLFHGVEVKNITVGKFKYQGDA
jgi:hypothetical protein